jgi:hypothetical protein
MLRRKLVPLFLITSIVTTCLPTSFYVSASSAGAGKVSVTPGTIASQTGDANISSTVNIASPATGGAIVAGDSTKEANTADLEKIINAVKSKITVPTTYTEFDYSFSEGSSNVIWTLNWSEKDNQNSISVQSDKDGNIVYYYAYSYNAESFVPKYLKTELKENADKFIKKVAPNLSGKYEYVSSNSEGTYNGVYNYQYQRVENGIPMPDNTITVGVNYENGKIVTYNSSWLYNVSIPSADTKITKDDAAKKIGKTVIMSLAYENAYTTDKNGNTTIKAFLVYHPDKDYVSVDAKTGEVYTTQNEWVDTSNGKGNMESASTSANAAGDKGLTQQEIVEVDKLKDLISKDNAIKAVTGNKSLLIDSNLKSITAKLYKQNNYYDSKKDVKYVWYITLTDPRDVAADSKDTYRASASATVDAVTGKILSFNSTVKDYYNMTEKEWENVKVKYSKEQGQGIFEKFTQEQIPDMFKNSVLTDNQDAYIIYYDKNQNPVYGGYNYNYDRVNEGIKYSYNGINGAVDGVTGKIYSFSYNWDDKVTFESPKNIISANEAFNVYISNEDYHLVYEINSVHSYSSKNELISTQDYSVANEVRLVYRTDIYPDYISPFTGRQLDSNGDVYTKAKDLYKYSDIDNSNSARNIKLLAEIGIGYEGGEFKPDKAITTEELTKFLSLAGFYYNDKKYAISNDSSTISRVDVSKFIVQILGFESVAQIKGIYATNFKDQGQITDSNIGYVALANGLNLIKSNSSNEFRPSDKLTRAEAADLIISMLSIEK